MVLLLREGKGRERKGIGEGEGDKGERGGGMGLEPPPLQISGYATGRKHA